VAAVLEIMGNQFLLGRASPRLLLPQATLAIAVRLMENVPAVEAVLGRRAVARLAVTAISATSLERLPTTPAVEQDIANIRVVSAGTPMAVEELVAAKQGTAGAAW
jgi:hypothetical protein